MAASNLKERFKPASKVAKVYGTSARTVYDTVMRSDYPMDGFRCLPSGMVLVDPQVYDEFLKSFNVKYRSVSRIRSKS